MGFRDPPPDHTPHRITLPRTSPLRLAPSPPGPPGPSLPTSPGSLDGFFFPPLVPRALLWGFPGSLDGFFFSPGPFFGAPRALLPRAPRALLHFFGKVPRTSPFPGSFFHSPRTSFTTPGSPDHSSYTSFTPPALLSLPRVPRVLLSPPRVPRTTPASFFHHPRVLFSLPPHFSYTSFTTPHSPLPPEVLLFSPFSDLHTHFSPLFTLSQLEPR